MNLDRTDITALALIIALLFSGVIYFAVKAETHEKLPTFEVVDAKRLDDCTYQVGLKDREGYYFSLTQDLVKFSAMGVNTNHILNYGEL